MLGKKKKEEEEVRAFLGKGAEFAGKLIFNGSVRIDGDFKGDIFGNGTLVSGEVRGQIDVKKGFKLYSTGKMLGDVNTSAFSVDEGAFFEGNCHMTGGETEVHSLPLPLPLERTAAGEKR
jgi:cytoskeletal protein CcmA (bactofilin family)